MDCAGIVAVGAAAAGAAAVAPRSGALLRLLPAVQRNARRKRQTLAGSRMQRPMDQGPKGRQAGSAVSASGRRKPHRPVAVRRSDDGTRRPVSARVEFGLGVAVDVAGAAVFCHLGHRRGVHGLPQTWSDAQSAARHAARNDSLTAKANIIVFFFFFPRSTTCCGNRWLSR